MGDNVYSLVMCFVSNPCYYLMMWNGQEVSFIMLGTLTSILPHGTSAGQGTSPSISKL